MLPKLDLRQVPPTTNGALASEVCMTVCMVIDPEFARDSSLTLLTSDNLLSSSPKAVSIEFHVPLRLAVGFWTTQATINLWKGTIH